MSASLWSLNSASAPFQVSAEMSTEFGQCKEGGGEGRSGWRRWGRAGWLVNWTQERGGTTGRLYPNPPPKQVRLTLNSSDGSSPLEVKEYMFPYSKLHHRLLTRIGYGGSLEWC